jgi:hypothetical protein
LKQKSRSEQHIICINAAELNLSLCRNNFETLMPSHTAITRLLTHGLLPEPERGKTAVFQHSASVKFPVICHIPRVGFQTCHNANSTLCNKFYSTGTMRKETTYFTFICMCVILFKTCSNIKHHAAIHEMILYYIAIFFARVRFNNWSCSSKVLIRSCHTV